MSEENIKDNEDTPLITEIENDLDEEGNPKAKITLQGKSVACSMLQAANKMRGSLTDIIHCYLMSDYSECGTMDGFCLDIIMNGPQSTYVEEYIKETDDGCRIPPEPVQDFDGDFFIDEFHTHVVFLAYAIGHAFDPGGPFEEENFIDFIQDRPKYQDCAYDL